jgi:hypothetical protein
MPGIYSVFIINKSGGLIFNKVCAGRQWYVNMMLRHAALVLAKHGEESFQSSSFAGVPVDKWLEPQRHAPFGQHLVRRVTCLALPPIQCSCLAHAVDTCQSSRWLRPVMMMDSVSASQALASCNRGAAGASAGVQRHRRAVCRHLHAALLSGPQIHSTLKRTLRL